MTEYASINHENFSQMMSAIKTGHVSNSRFAQVAGLDKQYGQRMERSGGGV